MLILQPGASARGLGEAPRDPGKGGILPDSVASNGFMGQRGGQAGDAQVWAFRCSELVRNPVSGAVVLDFSI